MNDKKLIAYLESERKRLCGLRPLAKRFGASAQYLCDILHGRRMAGKKILEPLGYKRKTIIKRNLIKIKRGN